MPQPITFRCPDDLLQALQHEEASGRSRTEIIVAALRARYGLSVVEPVASLEDLASQLELALSRIAQLETEMAAATERLDRIKAPKAKTEPKLQETDSRWQGRKVNVSWRGRDQT